MIGRHGMAWSASRLRISVWPVGLRRSNSAAMRRAARRRQAIERRHPRRRPLRCWSGQRVQRQRETGWRTLLIA
jgi:hypothetical protein